MTGPRAAAVVLLPLLLTGCAALSRSAGSDDGDAPRLRLLAAARDPRAEAYYDFAAAQLHVQAGRFKEAIPLLQEALKRDPNSAFLWTQLAQWMVRADQPAEALAAAQKAVQLAPDDPGPHLTLAELLRTQKNFREAEAEPSPPAERRERRTKTLGDDDRRDIEAAASAISDPALADAARRLLTKARRADHARGVTR